MRRFIITCLLLSLTLCLQAQAIKFVASTDTRETVENGTFTVQFTLENGEGTGFSPPDFKGLQVVQGPSTSSQMQIVNGRVTRQMGYSYVLLAPKVGTYTIAPASIRVKNTTFKTEPVSIKVLKAKQMAANANAAGANLFVKTELSDSLAFIGQQVTLKYVLYTTKEVNSADFLSEPEYEQFYVHRIRNFRDRQERVVIDGVQYVKKTLKTLALFPQQSGKITLDPSIITLGLPIRDGRSGGFFFNTRIKRERVTTEPVNMDLRSAPSGAPESFSGAIGNYTMRAVIDKRTVSTDDAVTVTMSVNGIGDGKFVQPPSQPTNASFEYYDPNIINDETYEQGDVIQTTKSFEYLIVPNKVGRHRLRPEFTYYNVDSNDYVTLYAGPFDINIIQGTGVSKTVIKEEVKELEALNPSTKLHSKDKYFLFSPLYWGFLSIPLFSMLGVVFLKQKKTKEDNVDPIEKKRNAARKMAMKRLEDANAARKANKEKQFYESVNSGVFGYISDKLNIPHSDISQEEIVNTLESKNVSQEITANFKSLVKICQMSLYAATPEGGMDKVYKDAEELILSLEEELV